MLDSFYHMTLKLFYNRIFSENIKILSQIRKVVLAIILYLHFRSNPLLMNF